MTRAPWVLTAALLATAIAYPLTAGGVRDAVSWTIVLLGSALTVVHAGLSRGWRTGLAVAAVTVAASVLFESVGLATGFPYGSYTYSDALGPTLLGVPFLVPLAWLMMVWPSWLLARRLVPAHRGGRIVVAAYVFAAWDVVLDPQLVQAGYWTWAHPTPGLPGIDTVPLTNLGGWLLAGLVLMALLDLLVADRPAALPDSAPLVALAWMVLGGALAHAGWLGLPGSAVWGVVLSLPVLVALARRRARTPAVPAPSSDAQDPSGPRSGS
ncbi:carotenoid biosynthesis protein [Klenkia taihuensis]|uniref:Putative membrane protein n=1 Tax=Klenkia taihuensis TaxID=1225127 RepID=A0A1I1SWQ8_9ACTN|nr:carotenoid biosynthesis protein [Klenkia taihuensis]GHE13145.1 membrane protein [Klenkia taihuensis]SFD50905.1 putative membrane protein [Klenkia taihuensis]